MSKAVVSDPVVVGPVVFEDVEKRFGAEPALQGVSLRLEPGRIVGLVGKNGSGKTTLLRLACGLALPTRGRVSVFGKPSGELDDAELARIGVVHQTSRFLPWMRVRQQIDYVSSFHARWDRQLARRLITELELDEEAKVSALSPGNVQKLALVLAFAPRPELLLLDEPVSALDPLAREALLTLLVELLQEQATTIVVSSHVLRDVERVVDWILCLERGRVVIDAGLDDLRERYQEWRVSSRNGALPARFAEGFVLTQEREAHQAVLVVRDAGDAQRAFAERHHAEIEVAPLNLERMFPLWTREARP
jgi:ABC-2 type transport system ATP-binding protein